MPIACLDVDYREDHARAACVVLQDWSALVPAYTYTADISEVLPYEAGSFYRRELPCLLAVLELLPRLPEILVIDGYVWVSADGKPGLGAYLYNAVHEEAAVVGVAKTGFHGMRDLPLVEAVCRGQSRNPLYVTSAGIELSTASDFIRSMHGEHRIPTALRLVDRLARTSEP